MTITRQRFGKHILEVALPTVDGHPLQGNQVTATVCGQRLGKHVPVAKQQIISNAEVGLQQWKQGVFYVVGSEML
jgi:hypothetical protein